MILKDTPIKYLVLGQTFDTRSTLCSTITAKFTEGRTKIPNMVPQGYSILALHLDPLPDLPLPDLEHDLHADEERRASSEHEAQALPRANNSLKQPLQSINPQCEPDQVCGHHHQDVEHGADAADDAICIRPVAPLLRGERHCRQRLG